MDVNTIDTRYQQLQIQNQQVAQVVQALAGELQTAADGGDQRAREWLLDLREVALTVQAEENSVGELVTAMHDFAAGSCTRPRPRARPIPASPAIWARPLSHLEDMRRALLSRPRLPVVGLVACCRAS